MISIQPFSKKELKSAAAEFLKITKGYKKFLFYGSMGSGKTTFIKAICEELGSVDIITSPTFALINEYCTFNNDMIYHFDLYRIESEEELLDIGFEEYVGQDSYIFIEWPEKAHRFINDTFITVNIEELSGNQRQVTLEI